ncbi:MULTISPECIES: DUF4232 domain-containing protein [unclassified Streptomyces]|uniref:DUF4232 domain-containing protein n=1 Tax=unclassified Streptomyces TaxID=2593676 RepID=UPI00278C5ADA|nr:MULTISPECIES: DUF4232 domain-containing protein [unclassified Streptomyces]
MRTTTWKTAATATATVLAATLGGGIAQAASPGSGTGTGTGSGAASERASAPSSCRPANHLARITPDDSSAGHSHYRVTLTAAPGYEPCVLAGSPVDVEFSEDGEPNGIAVGAYGPQDTPVVFGPGHPVHFDIQVPNYLPGVPADEATFTLSAPGGQIPGESGATGPLRVAEGTVVGPVMPGA